MTASRPTPRERFERAVEGLSRLPPAGAITFRGVTSAPGAAPGVVVTRGITATSLTEQAITRLAAVVATTLGNARGVPCPVEAGYCGRFAAPLV